MRHLLKEISENLSNNGKVLFENLTDLEKIAERLKTEVSKFKV